MKRRMKAFRGDGETFEEDLLMETQYEIKTEFSGYLNVFVKGQCLENITPTTPIFLTLHDLGTNHQDFHKLLEHPCMAKVKQRSIWIHVDIPGQEYDAIDLPPYFDFPTFDQICDDLIQVLDYFRIESCLTFGEGAGANILLRLSIKFPNRILGNILIHCMARVESTKYFFQAKLMSWKLNTLGMNRTADHFLVQHKFGVSIGSKKDLDTEQSIKEFLDKLHKRINPKNLRLFINAYFNRSDVSNIIKDQLRVDTMIVCGSYLPLRRMADEMQAQMDPKITTRLNIDHCASILDEEPDIFTNNLILFCQGLGLCQYKQ